MKIKYFFFFIIFLFSQNAFASHIRAGDITAVRDAVNPLKYTITLSIYFNSTRIYPLNEGGSVKIDDLVIYFGDGTSVNVTYKSLEDISAVTTKAVYVATHTYSGAANFTVSFKEQYRIDAIENINQSGLQDFYIETQLTVSPLLGLDALPILLVPPVDYANVNQIYTHTPGAYDPDGDSLSFDLVKPQIGSGKDAPGYVYPDNPIFRGLASDGQPARLTIDHQTGQVVWDTPGDLHIDKSNPNSVTYYNIAIRVTEWRNKRAIGYVVRDMQIIVRNGDNKRPRIIYSTPRCIEAGKLLSDSIQVTDPDRNQVSMYAFGSPLTILKPSAVFQPKGQINPQSTHPNFATAYFQWRPGCSAVRSQPYTVQFKAEDVVDADKKLTDEETYVINVLGPKPVWSTVPLVLEGTSMNTVRLHWDNYVNQGCTQTGIQFYIYRAECDSLYVKDSCAAVLSSGYTLIAKVASDALTYLDDNKGKGLGKGIKYYYAIQAIFPSPAKGKSQMSFIKGIPLYTDSPLPTNIIVETTSKNSIPVKNGSVKITWRKPALTTGLQAPYTYDLYRSKGFNTGNFGTIPIASNLSDTTYSDIIAGRDTLSTADNSYTYKIVLKDASGSVKTAEPISSVFLKGIALDKSARLTWEISVPWAIDHYNVYHKSQKVNVFTKKRASISPYDLVYQLTGLANCDTFVVYIEAVGKYCIDNNRDSIIAVSQQIVVVPISNQPLIANLKVTGGCKDLSCDQAAPQAPYINTLNWTIGSLGSCLQLRTFNIYFTPVDNEPTVLLHKTSLNDTSTSFVHSQGNGFAGCYEVETVLSVNGKEYPSPKSNRVCVDNCFCFDLPNVFTPNNDNVNNLYVPMKPPRFIEKVDFKVYNRWGKLVFKRDDDVNINWDGKDVPEGTYYYSAIVTYQSVYNESRQKTFKGWVELIR